MNKHKSSFQDLLKITWINVKDTMSLGNIVTIILIPAIFIIMQIVLPGKIQGTMQQIYDQTFTKLSTLLSIVVIIMVSMRLKGILKDKSNFDKNRVSFITFTRKQVIFSKIFSDSLLFLIPIMLTVLVAAPYLVLFKNGLLDSDVAIKLVLFILGMYIIYIVTSIGMRYITALDIDKLLKGVLLGVWIVLTIIGSVISSIIFGIMGLKIEAHNLRYVLAFVPFINLVTPWLVLYGFIDLWMIVPSLVYIFVLIVVFWNPFTSKLREYLCI